MYVHSLNSSFGQVAPLKAPLKSLDVYPCFFLQWHPGIKLGTMMKKRNIYLQTHGYSDYKKYIY